MANTAFDLYKVAEIELVYKTQIKASERPQITQSREAYDILMQSWDENKIEFVEQAKVLLLNRSNRVLGICEISSGGVSGTILDPKVVYVAALKCNASGIILSHNHPSGNLKASEQDKAVTSKFKEAGDFLDIKLHDHLIVSNEGYYSFNDDMVYEVQRIFFPLPF